MLVNLYFSHSLEFNATWQVPGNEEPKFSGKLNISKGRIILEATKSFSPSDDGFFSNESSQYDCLIGHSDDETFFKLFDTQEIDSQASSGSKTYLYGCKYLVISEQPFESSTDDLESAGVNFSYLEEWVGQRSLRVVRKDDKRTPQIDYSPPKTCEMNIPALNAKMSLKSAFKYHYNFRQVEIEHRVFLYTAPKAPKSIEWFKEKILDLNNLMTLLMGIPVGIQHMMGVHEGHEVLIFADGMTGEPVGAFSEYDILVPFRTIESQFHVILENWYSRKDAIHSSCDLLFGTFQNPNMPPRFQYLSIIQAIEGYHRSVGKRNKYLSRKLYDDYVYPTLARAIPSRVEDAETGESATIGQDLRDSLKKRMKYGNEFSLRKRLFELFRQLKPDVQKLITENYQSFSIKAVEMRNTLTHPDDSTESTSFTPEELYQAFVRLWILLILMIYKEIGLDSSDFQKRVLQNCRFFDLPESN